MKKSIIISLISLMLVFDFYSSYAQKEANVWYFGSSVGLDFNNEPPDVLYSSFSFYLSSSCMSDPDGNFLFATNRRIVMNSNLEVMQNGSGLIGGSAASQGAIIVQKPGSDHLYYIFTVHDSHNNPPGFYYSVVDMDLDGGLGAVTNEKNVPLNSAWDAYHKVIAVRHANDRDIWIITRKHEYDSYAAFLLTESGVEDSPVISYSPDRPANRLYGAMKISFDKKHFIAAYQTFSLPVNDPYQTYDICHFNDASGGIDFMYTVDPNIIGNQQSPNSVEFSPDSKLAYLCNWSTGPGNDFFKIFQYDMELIEDSAQFVQSALLITDKGGAGLQLARDGRIYCGTQSIGNEDSLNVIHKPWVRGTGCNYEENVISFIEGNGAGKYLPNILLDYLYRFEWEGQCQSSPFVFQSNFQPVPGFISWDFGDPGSGVDNYSNDLNPEHLFSAPGEYEVSVYVIYPGGRIEQTSRVVTVEDIPHPDLGPDVLVCEGEEVTLNAGDEEGMYGWSTGVFGQNLSEITVSDSGWYWVQLTTEPGCFGIDSLYVGWYPKATINEDLLNLVPTTCGGNNGMILGLEVTGEEPLSFEWYDADSNYLANTLDLTNLAVGNYFLHILDGNGCTTISDPYTITDAGDIEISTVEKESTHCKQSDGEIRIGANSLATDYLLYSIDNGNTWQANDSLFINLPAGNYIIRVSDTSGCESVYENNPVTIENIAGPEVTNTTTTPEIDYLSNGVIDITAVTNQGQIHYSIDNGSSFQTDNGLFTNLSAGIYYCMVQDDFGCDTIFIVEIERIFSQLIEAIAGDGHTCIGNAAVVPLKLNNFTDIYKFHVKLTYDTAILTCDGYINVHPDLEANLQAAIIPGTDEVIVSWQGEAAMSLEENAIMLELVFGAKEEGFSGIDWAATEGESVFYNDQLEEISADYHFGSLRIFTRPTIMMGDQREVCEGEYVMAVPFIKGGSGEVNYLWQGPNGFESTGSFIEFQNTTEQDAGIYTLTVTDTINCVESTEVTLTVNENPLITFSGQDTIFAEPGFILEAGSGYESYLWNTNETTDAIQINIEGLYSVFVISTESCESTDSVTVLWGGETFYLPNAFTPNGDGLNDEFKPIQRYDFVKTYHLSIYNRWGEMIFETGDIEQGWNGTYKGRAAPGGTYVYRIVYTAYLTGTETQVKTGSVTLVK